MANNSIEFILYLSVVTIINDKNMIYTTCRLVYKKVSHFILCIVTRIEDKSVAFVTSLPITIYRYLSFLKGVFRINNCNYLNFLLTYIDRYIYFYLSPN